jgi:hypothetical protein
MVGENPYIKKLRVETECEEAKLISLAREAEASAQYHRMRAREWAAEQERIAANQYAFVYSHFASAGLNASAGKMPHQLNRGVSPRKPQ